MKFDSPSYSRAKIIEMSRKRKPRKKEEETLAQKVSTFLKIQHPKLIFRFDIGADVKLTMGQAVKAKKLQGDRGYPDLFIAKASNGYHGLYVELKKDKSEVFLKDGVTFKRRVNKKTGKCHIQEQHEMHERLRAEGYQVVWGFGFDDTVNKIKEYLK